MLKNDYLSTIKSIKKMALGFIELPIPIEKLEKLWNFF